MFPHQSGDIHDERDKAIAHDRGAGDPFGVFKQFPERFDDDLFLPQKGIDDEAQLPLRGLDDDDVGVLQLLTRLNLVKVRHPEQREDLVSEFQDLLALNRLDLALVDLQRFDDHSQGYSEPLLTDRDKKRLDDGQSQGEFEDHLR